MKIYFGNTLIDEDYYLSISNSHNLFNETFELGSTASNSFTISIGKEAVATQPTQITIKDNSNNIIAIVNVDSISEDDYSYTYSCTDTMTKLNFNYDASAIFVGGSTTLLAIAQDICTKASITLGTNNFRGYNKTISFYDNTKTAREYVSYIAELNGGYAYIENNVLYFKKINTASVQTIDINECEDFKLSEYHKITKVIYELGTIKYEYGNNSGDTLYLRGENVYINTQAEVQEIYNEINNFEFYTFETNNCPMYDIKAGQIITFTNGTNNYKTIACIERTYNGTWVGGYKLNIASSVVQETQNNSLSEHVKKIDIKVDRNTGEISQTISRVDDVEDELTGKVNKTQIISSINQSAEAITINANKISLSGKNIGLTSDNITISSNNFSVDANGNINCTGGDIGGFDIDTYNLTSETRTDRYLRTDPYKCWLAYKGQYTPTIIEKARWGVVGTPTLSDVARIYQYCMQHYSYIKLQSGKYSGETANLTIKNGIDCETIKISTTGMVIKKSHTDPDEVVQTTIDGQDITLPNEGRLYGKVDENYTYHAEQITIGDTVATKSYIASGYVSSSTTKLFINIILPKRVHSDAYEINCTSCNVEARGINGYLNSESGFHEFVDRSGYTISVQQCDLDKLTLVITKSSAWTNVSNNTPIVLNGKFTFEFN